MKKKKKDNCDGCRFWDPDVNFTECDYAGYDFAYGKNCGGYSKGDPLATVKCKGCECYSYGESCDWADYDTDEPCDPNDRGAENV